MNAKSIVGAFAVGLAAVGTFTAQAERYYWTGAGTDTKWSNEDNWAKKDGTKGVPGSADAAWISIYDPSEAGDMGEFSHEGMVTIVLDADTTVKGLHVFSDTTLVGGHKLTVKGPSSELWWGVMIRNKKLFVSGENTAVEATSSDGKSFNMNSRASIYAIGGGSFKGNFMSFGDNAGQWVVASNANSKVVFTRLQLSGSNNDPNSDEHFVTYDGGVIEVNNKSNQTTYNPFSPTVEAKTGSIKLDYLRFNNGAPVVRCADGVVTISQFNQNVAGAEISVSGTGRLTSNYNTLSMGYGSYAATLSLSGTSPQIVHTPNANFNIYDNTTFTLAPELTWSETEGRIKLTGTGVACMFTKKITVDCTAFADWYGTKTIMLFQQASANNPTYNFDNSKVTKTGAGADKCTVTFAKSGQNLMMTIDSKNLAEGSVARVGHYGYPTIQAAFDAAGASGETVCLLGDVALAAAVSVTNAVTFDLGAYSVTGADGIASTELFSVTKGGALTVTGSGTVNGGDVAAVRATGGAFYVPADSEAAFVSANDAVVLTNAGVAPTAEIVGGSFASADGKPVASEAAAGYDPVDGFLKGGVYNKEPEAALVANGFVAEKIGDTTWEVVQDGEPVCQIGERTFASLARAFRSAKNGDTITMVTNEHVTAALTLDRDVSIIFQLNECDLSPEEGTTLLTVAAGTVDIRGKTLLGGVVLNGGTLKINATVNAPDVAITANGGTLNVTDGSYTGATSAFAAGKDFNSNNCNIDAGTFSSAIESKYLKANRKMEQQGDNWVVLLVKDESQVTYTWKDDASGAWTNVANWATPANTRCIGYPATGNNNSYLATATFPGTIAEGAEVLVDGEFWVKDFVLSNTKLLKFVFDNGKIIDSTAQNTSAVKFGETGPVEITFKGERPQFKAQYFKGRIFFGEKNETKLAFELPVIPWKKDIAPIVHTYDDAPIKFGSNSSFRVDLKNMVVPKSGHSVTNALAYNKDGIRFDDSAKTLSALEVVNCPVGVKGELAVGDGCLYFIATKRIGFMLIVQ